MSQADFQTLQRRFAAHLRNPQNHSAPGDIEERRLDIYRTLFFNNVNGFITQGFPVLYSILDAQRWQRLVRTFFDQHACQTPYFLEIPQEFVTFLASGQGLEEGDPPFLLELAHYEWMELVLDASTEQFPTTGFHPEGDLLRAIPQLSPLHAVLSYQYPVHEICVEFQPQTPLSQPLWLLVYRDRADQVRFMEINAPTARLLQLIEENPDNTGFQVVGQLAEELQFADVEKLAAFARDILLQMHQRDILIGASLKPC
ncbi:putative DNA-binding domain-containing protein [uncultured Alcanivorax sp.]|uniref:HvfC family RiPP maturation protein n=1 Tax=uncultured Alcanivorax sp. TaxID=191215 RepID=UPI0026378869|nr:putative DNA-binding domain-containing protein [uncultured Alcanivorax sp.]